MMIFYCCHDEFAVVVVVEADGDDGEEHMTW